MMYYAQDLSGQIVGAAIAVHRELGPGLLESAYEACLAREFLLCGLSFNQQVPLGLTYKGVQVDCGYRLDFVVDERVVVELKSVEALLPIHEAQLFTYLKLSGYRLGLLINFNVMLLKDGIRRRVL